MSMAGSNLSLSYSNEKCYINIYYYCVRYIEIVYSLFLCCRIDRNKLRQTVTCLLPRIIIIYQYNIDMFFPTITLLY